MVYFRIFLYNVIAIACVFAMITTTFVQGRLVFDDPDLGAKIGRIIIQILVPNLIYLVTILFSMDWMRQFINAKLTYKAKGNGINVDTEYDNGKIEREWFESLPRLIDEEFLKCWSDRWLDGHFDDLGIKFWIDDIAYSSIIYKKSDPDEIAKSFALPERALLIEYNQADVFGEEWIVWLNSYNSSKAIESTNYQDYHRVELNDKSKGMLFFKDQSLSEEANRLKIQLEQNMDVIFSAEVVMFRQNMMILYADNIGDIKLKLPLFLTPSSYRAALSRQQANIYKMCQLLITLSKLN